MVGAGPESFTLCRADTGVLEAIAYAGVKTVKGRQTPALIKLAVAVGAVVGTIVVITALALPKT